MCYIKTLLALYIKMSFFVLHHYTETLLHLLFLLWYTLIFETFLQGYFFQFYTVCNLFTLIFFFSITLLNWDFVTLIAYYTLPMFRLISLRIIYIVKLKVCINFITLLLCFSELLCYISIFDMLKLLHCLSNKSSSLPFYPPKPSTQCWNESFC